MTRTKLARPTCGSRCGVYCPCILRPRPRLSRGLTSLPVDPLAFRRSGWGPASLRLDSNSTGSKLPFVSSLTLSFHSFRPGRDRGLYMNRRVEPRPMPARPPALPARRTIGSLARFSYACEHTRAFMRCQRAIPPLDSGETNAAETTPRPRGWERRRPRRHRSRVHVVTRVGLCFDESRARTQEWGPPSGNGSCHRRSTRKGSTRVKDQEIRGIKGNKGRKLGGCGVHR